MSVEDYIVEGWLDVRRFASLPEVMGTEPTDMQIVNAICGLGAHYTELSNYPALKGYMVSPV